MTKEKARPTLIYKRISSLKQNLVGGGKESFPLARSIVSEPKSHQFPEHFGDKLSEGLIDQLSRPGLAGDQ